MRSVAEPFKVFLESQSTAAPFTSNIYDNVGYFGQSWQVVTTGTPTGNLTLQMSNDGVNWITQPTDAVNAVNPVVYSGTAKSDMLVYHTMRPFKYSRFSWGGSGAGTMQIWGCGVRLA